MAVERKLSKILKRPPGERDVELRGLAEKLGCSLHSLVDPQTGKSSEVELVRRIRDANRSRREARLWIVALVSAVASVFAAAAAWAAVLLATRS